MGGYALGVAGGGGDKSTELPTMHFPGPHNSSLLLRMAMVAKSPHRQHSSIRYLSESVSQC